MVPMTSSFATYASQFLNRQNQVSSSLSNSQPLFYSFTTEGSRRGLSDIQDDIELDDEEDPHFGHSSNFLLRRQEDTHDEEDPYLRLDEDEHAMDPSLRRDSAHIPLIASERTRQESGHGWLSHQAAIRSMRAPPSPPSDISSESGTPPADMFLDETCEPRMTPTVQARAPLTESLLPRDGVSRPKDAFNIPDARHLSRHRLVRKDSHWTAAWLASVTACVIGSFIILFTTSVPKSIPENAVIPYTTLLHTIPLLSILTFVSAVVSYAHILLLGIFVKPVMFATSAFIPFTLFISAVWAFVGSFMWESGTETTWSETVGLRVFSMIPLVLAVVTGRRLLKLPEEIHTTSSILKLSTTILSANPFLLALSPLILLITLIGSIPFITLSFRLLLIGNSSTPTTGTWEWHVKNWAGWSIAGTALVWLWCWGVSRGVLRTACAVVVGAWYFSPPELQNPPPLDTYRMHAAIIRSTDTSLGSIVISALLLTGIRLLYLLGWAMRRAPVPLIPWFAMPLRFVGNMTGSLSTLALVYVGLTGDEFFPSARRARVLAGAVSTTTGKVRYRRDGVDSSLAMLTITPLTLTLPFALGAYLFVAHTLSAPGYAPIAALLAGGVTALVGKFCTGLIEDTADTLYMCYCIDRDSGHRRREEVFSAFEWQQPSQANRRPANQQQQHPIPAPARPRAPSPALTESDADITIREERPRESRRVVTPYSVEPAEPMEDSQTSEESTMLGLDFV